MCREAGQGTSSPVTSRRPRCRVPDRKGVPAVAMKIASAAQTHRGVGQLLREVAQDGAHLARQEVNLARIEFAQIARDIGKGTVFAVAAAMLGLLTVQMLGCGLPLLRCNA